MLDLFENEPFAMVVRNKEKKAEEEGNSEEEYEGYCIDLIKLLADKVGFKHKVQIVKDGQYGAAQHDGSWDGMIGELLNKVRLYL